MFVCVNPKSELNGWLVSKICDVTSSLDPDEDLQTPDNSVMWRPESSSADTHRMDSSVM